MKGLSTKQLGVLALCALALALTLVAALLKQWQLAALAGVAAFGIFVVFTAFTLAAMTHTLETMRKRLVDIDTSTRSALASSRRIDHRTADRFKALDATEARIEAAERRLLATLESHRFALEDDVAEVKEQFETLRRRD
ncbi:hypothetical protein [Nesterenkonia alba]|uniref:hypothetical protein n=1 Tax=Nesterenkonia alba TaxID=515814 RepID=UPI0003B70FAD|nr:hypothetical protein [Nesterenkonia alba]